MDKQYAIVGTRTHLWKYTFFGVFLATFRLSGHLVKPILSEFMLRMPLFGSTCGSSNARRVSSGEPAPPTIEVMDPEESG
jgi:hypothetical protein